MTPTAADGDLPPTALVRVNDTHRLIPSKYRPGGESVLARIAGSDAHLADLFDLDHATNERLLAENSLLPGIGPHELVFDVPNCRVVNAVFTHPHPLGSRFNGPERGAWYAAFALETAQAEVAFHKATEYAEIGRFDDSVTYDDYLADFSAEFHDIRADDRFAACHDPDSYRVSQALADRLLDTGSLGVAYRSARDADGSCIACFRPAIVGNVRRHQTWRFIWDGSPQPTIEAS